MTPIIEIIRAGCRFYNVGFEAMTGPCRPQYLIIPRFSVMAACRKEGYRFNTIGEAFNRDHGSVLHAIKKTTPESFGNRWREHLRFMELVEVITTTDRAPDVINEEIHFRILDIDNEIKRLNQAKEKLLRASRELATA